MDLYIRTADGVKCIEGIAPSDVEEVEQEYNGTTIGFVNL